MRDPAVHLWLAALVVALFLIVLPLPDWTVEKFYSRDLYPIIQTGLTNVSNLFPLALLDVFLLGAAVLILWRIGRLWGVMREVGVLDALWDGFRRLVRAASIATILFFVFWGMNYRRVPLDEALNLPAFRPSVSDLEQAVSDGNALAVRVRPLVGSATLASYESIAGQLETPFNAALKRVGRPSISVPGRPKYSLVLTPFFTRAGINGMIDPFALESIVHPDLLPFERPFVLAHEWAHLAGAADEAEASTIGWLACMQGNPLFAYSASIYLIEEAGGSLPRDRWQEAAKKLDPDVRDDLRLVARRMQGENPEVEQAASRVYDSYLHANRVDDGVASYDRALQLILSPPIRDALGQYQVIVDRRSNTH